MALLQYDFRVVGENLVHGALGRVERHAAQVNRNAKRGVRPGAGGQHDSHVRAREVEAKRIAAAEQKAAAQATLYWQKAAQKSADHRLREQDRVHKKRLRQIEREDNAERRAVRQALRANERLAARNRSERMATGRAIVGGVGRSAVGTLGAVGRYAGTALGLAGTFAVGSALQTEVSERAAASKLAIQAKQPEIKGALLQEARGIQGFTGAEGLGALEAFITKTGDLGAGRAALQDLATIALATSSDFVEMGEAAGQAFNVIRDTISDPKQQLDALNEVMASLAAQGTLGAVEIRDMAKELGGLGAATRRFAGGPVELLKTVGAVAQAAVARGGASSAAEATTSVVRFSSDLTKSSGQNALKKLGINAFTDKSRTQLRSPQELMLDILDKTQGDLTKVTEIFGEYGLRAFQGFAPLFTDAERKQKGSGRAAVLAEFEKFTGAASSPEELRRLAGTRLTDEDIQFKEAMKAFNQAVGDELLPTITRLIPEFVKLLPHIEKATRAFAVIGEEIARNPIGGIGQLIAAKIALDLAGAGIGQAAKAALQTALSGGLSRALGMAGLSVGVLAASIELANLAVTALKVEGETAARGAVASANEVRDRARAELATTGTLSEDTKRELQQLGETEQKTIAAGQAVLKEGLGATLGRGINQIFGGDEDLSQKARLQATVTNEDYRAGAQATQDLLAAADIGKRIGAEAGKEFLSAIGQAGEDFKAATANAANKMTPNRGNTPDPGNPTKS